MSVEWSKGIKEILINESEKIVIESKRQEVYEWDEVSYKIGEDVIFIGSYSTYNCRTRREWMEFNEYAIVILTQYIPSYLEIEDEDCDYDDSIHVKILFDIKNRCHIEGSQKELLEYYNRQLCKENSTNAFNNSLKKLL